MLPAAFVTSLAECYQVPKDRVARFQNDLNQRCERFIERRTQKAQEGSLKEQHKALALIISKSQTFREFIDELPEPVRNLVGTATGDLNGESFDVNCMLFETTADELPPPDANKSFLNLELLRPQLTLLIEGSEYARQVELTQPTRGPATDQPFEDWIADMRLVWRTSMGRAFTRDDYKGSANSPAAEFCVKVCAVVAPDMTEQTVLNAMKNGSPKIGKSRKHVFQPSRCIDPKPHGGRS